MNRVQTCGVAVISLLLMVWSSAALAAEVRVSQLLEEAYFVQATEGGKLWKVGLWIASLTGAEQHSVTSNRIEA